MSFSSPYSLRALTFLVALGLTAGSVLAQHATLPPGEAIMFSSPDTDAVATNLSSLSPRPPESLVFGSTVEAPPTLNFNRTPSSAPMSLGAPAVSAPEPSQLQDQLDRRNNWMLMTPAEIYGVTTPEMILGIPERDALGQRKRTTALERYTERQNQMAAPANPYTNAVPTWSSFDKRPDALTGDSGSPDDLVNPLFRSSADKSVFARQNENNSWSKLFSPMASAPMPAPSAARQIDKQNDMERFQQLLTSGSPTAGDTAAPVVRGMKISVPQSPLDSTLGQPAINPAGGSFAPLSDGIGKPAGLPKLPGAWNLSLTSALPSAAWAPQPPPWLSPQPFAVPQRKF